jgi:hypothetical protein
MFNTERKRVREGIGRKVMEERQRGGKENGIEETEARERQGMRRAL